MDHDILRLLGVVCSAIAVTQRIILYAYRRSVTHFGVFPQCGAAESDYLKAKRLITPSPPFLNFIRVPKGNPWRKIDRNW